MGAIGKTNKLLSSVIDRMDKQETRMCQQKIDASSSLSSSASSTPVSSRRKEVPLQVRVSVIVTNYKYCLREATQFSYCVLFSHKLWAASVMVILYGILINCCSMKHAESIPCLWMKILITSMDGQLEMGEFDIYLQFPIIMNVFRCQSTHCPRLSLQYSHSHNTLQATCFIFLRAGVEAVPLYIEAHRKVINSVCMNADLYTYP